MQIDMFAEPAIDQGEIGKQQGMATAEAAIDVRAGNSIDLAIAQCAREYLEFTSEDVKPLVHPVPTKWLCLGGAFTRAANQGLIEKTSHQKKSDNPACHKRPQSVWRSLVYRQVSR